MAQDAPRAYLVQARSTDTFGRVLCSARNHHFVVDGPVHNGCPGEAMTPAEIFLAGVAACGVELVQVFANEQQLSLQSIGLEVTGTIDRANPVRPDVTLFNAIQLRFNLHGVSPAQAWELVKRFQGRCPLYGSIKVATPEVRVDVSTKE